VSIVGLPSDDIDSDEMALVVSLICMAHVLEEVDCSADGDQLPLFKLGVPLRASIFPLTWVLDRKSLMK
jgi:hypothetical protein